MVSLIRLISIFVLTSSVLFSQNITRHELKEKVHGIVYHGNQQYLVTDRGYIKVENQQKSVNDKWTDYYRKAYGDSTIQNPNTIIEQPRPNIGLHFFMSLNGRDWIDKEYEFGEEAYLYDFIQADDNGNFVFRPGIIGVIGRLQTIPKRK